MPETVQLRIHDPEASPTLIYLPGLHGDWTLIRDFRKALGGRVRFVEATYPHTVDWSLEDYARGVGEALRSNGIHGGWLLAESFGSQVAWALVAGRQLSFDGLILAGGFVKHPFRPGARLVARVVSGISLSLFTRILSGYARIARIRYRRSPETLANIQEFIDRRTEPDRRAITHRLHLIAQNDPRASARQCDLPVFAVTGAIDPIVPWFLVRPWLRRGCPDLREYKIIWRADHNVLSTAASASAEQVLGWIKAG